MITARLCKPDDKENIKRLWIELFNDSERFTDWFFENRFLPEYCACAYDADTLVSVMQSIPVNIKIRDKVIPSTIISGVSTKDTYRKKGYMHMVFNHYMNSMRTNGIVLTTLKAVSIPTYHSVGHYACTQSAYVELKKDNFTNPIKTQYKCLDTDMVKQTDGLLQCYKRFCRDYSAIIIRTHADFALKMRDYLSDDAQCISITENERTLGYCIFFIQEQEIYAEEFIAVDGDVAIALAEELLDINKKVTIKTSQKVAEWINHDTTVIKEQNSMGVANVQKLLHMVCNNKEYSIKVTDPMIQSNNGIFLFNGDRTNGDFHLELPANQLVRLLCGYMSLEELVSENFAYIHDKIACEEISKILPKTNCFIVDEY